MDYAIPFALIQMVIFLAMVAMPIIALSWIIRTVARPVRKTIQVFKK